MTDDSRLRQQQARGHRAKRILEDDLVIEAFEKIETVVTEAWQNSPADAEKERYNAYLMHRLLKQFKEHFRQIVVTGDHAGKELLRLKEPSKLRKIFNA
jgi:hypothetical protein